MPQFDLPEEEDHEAESCRLTLSRDGSPFIPANNSGMCHGCNGCAGSCHQCSACHYSFNGIYGCTAPPYAGGSILGKGTRREPYMLAFYWLSCIWKLYASQWGTQRGW